MSKSADICPAIGSFPISYRDLHDLEILLNSPENEIKVTERIEFPKIAPVGVNSFIIFSEKALGPAEGIFESLIENPSKHKGKELVSQQIQKPHGLLFHRVDEAAAVYEFTLVLLQGPVEFGKIFRWYCKVCIEYHQDVTFCG